MPRKRVIEEIVVTAQKKEESIQDVPMSITALTGDFLEDAQIDDVHELVELTPNVRFATNETVFIRGIGNPFGGSSFDPSVGLAIDELSIVREQYLSEPLFDIERFEVLRGPQGTLFGKNTPAGLFNITTATPTRELTGHVLGRLGGLGVHRLEAAIGGPLGPFGDVAQFRLAVLDSGEERDVRNTKLGIGHPDKKQQAGRLKLALQPLDDLDILLMGSLSRTDEKVFDPQAHDHPESSVEFQRRFDPQFEDDGFDHQSSIDYPERWDKETHLLQSNVTYGLGNLGPVEDLELVAILGLTGFDLDRPLDTDLGPADILNLDRPTVFPYDQRSAELRVSATAPAPFDLGEIEALMGVLVFESELFSVQSAIAGEHLDDYLLSASAFELLAGQPPPGGIGFPDLGAAAGALGIALPAGPDPLAGDGIRFLLDQELQSQAIFGRAAWHWSDRWTLSFGGRVTFEKKDARIESACLEVGLLCAAFAVSPFDVRRDRSETDFSPKVTLEYRPSDELLLFALRSQGFKSGGFNNVNFSTERLDVDSEKTVAWEAGAKGTLFDRSLSWSATAFHMDIDDLQVQIITGTFLVVRNAASARTRGVEVDFEWLTPWEPLSFQGAAALTDARFRSYRDAPPPITSAEETQDLSGRPLPFSPKRQVNVTPMLRFPFALPEATLVGGLLPRDLVATAAADVLYRGSLYLDGDLDPKTLQDDYVTVDARLALSAFDEALSLRLAVKNATNTDALDLVIDSPLFPRGYAVTQEFQRNYSFELAYHW